MTTLLQTRQRLFGAASRNCIRYVSTGSLRSVDSIIKERAALAAVQELEQASDCEVIDIAAVKLRLGEFTNHFGFTHLNRVAPLVFAWKKGSDISKHLAGSAVAECQQASKLNVPLVTMVDYVNENVAGHPGVIHGGMTTTMANSLMGLVAALNFCDKDVAVSTMKMDYRKPVFTANFIKAQAWLSGVGEGAVSTAVRFYDLQNQLLYEAVSDMKVTDREQGSNR